MCKNDDYPEVLDDGVWDLLPCLLNLPSVPMVVRVLEELLPDHLMLLDRAALGPDLVLLGGQSVHAGQGQWVLQVAVAQGRKLGMVVGVVLVELEPVGQGQGAPNQKQY